MERVIGARLILHAAKDARMHGRAASSSGMLRLARCTACRWNVSVDGGSRAAERRFDVGSSFQGRWQPTDPAAAGRPSTVLERAPRVREQTQFRTRIASRVLLLRQGGLCRRTARMHPLGAEDRKCDERRSCTAVHVETLLGNSSPKVLALMIRNARCEAVRCGACTRLCIWCQSTRWARRFSADWASGGPVSSMERPQSLAAVVKGG